MHMEMKAAVVRNWGEAFVIEDRPIPQPKSGEALLKVRAAGVGLTLLNMRSGRFGGTPPRIMGHELGGDIVALGDGVTNIKVGDRATVYFLPGMRTLPVAPRRTRDPLREFWWTCGSPPGWGVC
jgi:D-arabinose 1-dehydrogenase-like Zn-dependent alcohol dehydrogenase